MSHGAPQIPPRGTTSALQSYFVCLELRGGLGGEGVDMCYWGPLGECLPGTRPACYFSTSYFSINYPDFSPRFTLSLGESLHCARTARYF